MIKISTLLLFIFTVQLLFAQNKPTSDGVVSGKVIDLNSSQPIDYVSFRLFLAKDSSLVAGIYSDAEGKFTLEQVPLGNFYGKLSFSGYKTLLISDIKISSTIKVANLGTLKLELENSKQLGEIKVIGKMDILNAGIDKKVYNVAQDLSVKGGTANDVLNNVPSVEVDQEGKVMLRGSGTVTILIDGRPSSLSGGNGKTLLDALPAGSIERIEVVSNPSAKYDPDGTSGIINIVLKKNKLTGFNGLITGSAGSGNLKTGNVFDGSVSLSYRNSKFNVFGSYSGRYLAGYRNNYTNLHQTFSNGTSDSLSQSRIGTDLNAGHTVRFGTDFYLKPRNVLGISMTGSLGERNRTGTQWNSKFDSFNTQTALWNRTSDDPTQQHNLDINANYKFDLKEDRGSLVVDVNQSLGKEDIQGFYKQTYFTNDSVAFASQPIQQRLNNAQKNNITSGQIDFTYLYPKINSRLETGVKTILRNQGVETYSESYDTLQNLFKEDTLANFSYAYNEQIYSAYGIFGQQLGKFKYQAGIRLEKAYQIPNLKSDSIRIVNDYFNFFPSGHIRYSITKVSDISLSYSRRINRAQSSDLNPFTNYSDPFNLQRGNPYLQPEFIDSYDLGYSNEFKKVSMTASVFYRHTTGVITRLKEYYSDNTSAVTFANIDESQSLGLEAIAIVKPFKWWRNTLSVNANYLKYIDNSISSNFNRTGYNWNFKYSGTFDFWKKTATIQINAAYNAPRFTVQGTAQRRGPIDISTEKTFNGGKWSLGARVSDVFNRQGFHMTVDQNGVQQTSDFKWLTRRVYVTFTYKFGKFEVSKAKGAGGEGGSEM